MRLPRAGMTTAPPGIPTTCGSADRLIRGADIRIDIAPGVRAIGGVVGCAAPMQTSVPSHPVAGRGGLRGGKVDVCDMRYPEHPVEATADAFSGGSAS